MTPSRTAKRSSHKSSRLAARGGRSTSHAACDDADMPEWRVYAETPEGAVTEVAQLERFAESLEGNDDALGAAVSMDAERETLSATFHVQAPEVQEAAWKAFWAYLHAVLGRPYRPDYGFAAGGAGGDTAGGRHGRIGDAGGAVPGASNSSHTIREVRWLSPSSSSVTPRASR